MTRKSLDNWSGATTSSPEETRKAGAAFVERLKPGDVIALHGSLGSGKTTFVQGMVRGLGLGEQVSSPTFALIHEYGYPPQFFHVDCYRETSAERWKQIGLSEYFDREAISAIEWAIHVESLLPERTYHLTFLPGEGDHERVIEIKR
ncbi:tRNA (adenosine(37)-N6)-threonylcarbamoyltransferase complex ATPase subunit type 1 TsaE [Candidatus Neomarinimicrobiota bacterium]